MTLLWYADGSRGIRTEWASITDVDNSLGVQTSSGGLVFPSSRSALDTTTKPPGAFASYASTNRIGDIDATSSSGQRAELGMGNPTREDMYGRLFHLGDDRWIAFQVYLDSTFDVNVNTWNLVAQFKQLSGFGSPVLALEVRNGVWRVDRTSNDPNNETLSPAFHDLGPALNNTWTKFCFHEYFHTDPAQGFYEVYGDIGDGGGYRQLRARTTQATMKISDGTGGAAYPSGVYVPCHLRVGTYRDRTIARDSTLRVANIAVATTQAEAEDKSYNNTPTAASNTPTFFGRQVVTFGTRTSMPTAYPASIRTGDLLILGVSVTGDRSTPLTIPPAGWLFGRLVYNATIGDTVAYYYRLWNGSDAAPTIAWGGANTTCGAHMLAYRGGSIHQTDPMYGWSMTAVLTSRTPSAAGPVVVANDSRALWVEYHNVASTIMPPTGFDVQVNDSANSGMMFTEQVVPAGDMGTLRCTSTAAVNHLLVSAVIRPLDAVTSTYRPRRASRVGGSSIGSLGKTVY